MNCKEFRSTPRANLDYTYYNKVRKIQKSLQYNSDPNAKVIHHLRDTEEQGKYNDEHYELWGIEIDEDGNEHFEYGKYVIFVTHDEHVNIHKVSDETRDKISKAVKGKAAGNKNPMYGVHRFGNKNPMYGRRGENNPWYGGRHSNETKQLISEAIKEVKELYNRYKNNGGSLKWNEFQRAVKLNEIDLTTLLPCYG